MEQSEGYDIEPKNFEKRVRVIKEFMLPLFSHELRQGASHKWVFTCFFSMVNRIEPKLNDYLAFELYDMCIQWLYDYYIEFWSHKEGTPRIFSPVPYNPEYYRPKELKEGKQ